MYLHFKTNFQAVVNLVLLGKFLQFRPDAEIYSIQCYFYGIHNKEKLIWKASLFLGRWDFHSSDHDCMASAQHNFTNTNPEKVRQCTDSHGRPMLAGQLLWKLFPCWRTSLNRQSWELVSVGWHNINSPTYRVTPVCFERFMEGQAFLRSYNSTPRPSPPPPLSRK